MDEMLQSALMRQRRKISFQSNRLINLDKISTQLNSLRISTLHLSL
jgi:hypothetical protein